MEVRKYEQFALVLKALAERWQPHPGQVAPGRALFFEGIRKIFLRFGRQSGKTQWISHAAVLWALTRPGSRVAIISPFLKQTRQIYLHSGLVEKMIPAQYLTEIHSTDGRYKITNGSIIELYGADNAEALRGLTFDLVFIDEAKDISLGFISSVVTATTLVRRAPLVISGTPPETAEHDYWVQVKQAQTDPEWREFHLTSYDNPYIRKEDLDAERERYKARGEEDVFIREFLAEHVPGQKRSIFPMLNERDHTRPFSQLLSTIYKRPESWTYYCALDPGTASVFAGLAVAINHYKGQAFVMGEVYATNQNETSIGQFWPKMLERMHAVYQPEPDTEPWLVVVDEAAVWARNELVDRFQQASFPTNKAQNKKADGLSLIKDLLNTKQLLISDECKNLLREMRGYMLGDNGLPIKKNDHAIDALRYALGISNFSVQTSAEPIPPAALTPGQINDPRRAFTPEEDLATALGTEMNDYLLESYVSWDD